MSPTMQARPLHIKFSRSTGKLLKRLWKTNSLDLILDFTLSYVSIVFNYAGPYFLKQILDSLGGDGRNPEKRALAFVYAFLAFASSLCKVLLGDYRAPGVAHLYLPDRERPPAFMVRPARLHPDPDGAHGVHLRQGPEAQGLLGHR